VDEWRRDPHPLWDELVDVARMRAQADAWHERHRASTTEDSRVFQLVALDRFLRTWFGREPR
jgi:hypothetical protein